VYFQAYIREGTALQQIGQHADALAAFASGLAQDTSNTTLLSGLTECVLKSPLKGGFGHFPKTLHSLPLTHSINH